MGSSGDFHDFTGSTDDSEKKFRSASEEAERFDDQQRVRNVFVSFNMDDEAQVKLLTTQAKDEKFDLEFRDYSVKEPFDEKWRAKVRERIKLTSATIVMIGPETANRPAVNYEIEESYRQGKKVIGVRIYKNKDHPIPKAMIEHNAPIINWRLTNIQNELDKP